MKPLLLEQLKNSHTHQDWFVPTKLAIEGLSHEQATWKDSTDNHSIFELVSHMIFWHGRVLHAFKGDSVPDYSSDNEETFVHEHTLDWAAAAMKLDSIQTDWKRVVERASDEKLIEWSTEISNMAGHAAYHTGQIVYIRKRNGWWR